MHFLEGRVLLFAEMIFSITTELTLLNKERLLDINRS